MFVMLGIFSVASTLLSGPPNRVRTRARGLFAGFGSAVQGGPSMRWMRLRVAFVATLGLLAGGALGCAEERDPINQVQANALAKSFFVGDDLHDDADNPE